MSELASTQDHPDAGLMPSTELRTTQDGAAQPVRILILAAVCLGVAALAAAAFVLSYSGIHAVARQAGISPQHARYYPALIDAMLVITLLAVLGLRGAGLPSRILSWLALLCVLAAAAGADELHATGRMLRHTAGAATAAALPWALVFVAFVLLIALLRHARLRHQASVARRQSSPLATEAIPAFADQPIATPAPPSLPVRTPRTWDSASIVPGFSARLVSSAAAGAAAAAAEEPGPPADAADHGPAAADRDQDDTSVGLAGADDADMGENAEPAAAESADTDAPPADAPPADVPTEAADDLAEPGEAEPADTDAPPADAPPADPAAELADAAVEPGDPAAEPGDPAAAESGAAAMAADAGSVGTFPAQDESDDPGTSNPAAPDEGADEDEDVADNMPVFHRMWSTPTPPDS
jgi:hypothetical protein